MCDKCVEIDERIERHRRIVSRTTDELTNERLAELIADLQAQKAAFHPKPKE
jgi:hypothetical protein